MQVLRIFWCHSLSIKAYTDNKLIRFIEGAGKTKIIESLNGMPGRERYPILIQSIIQEFNLERVILVACDHSAAYVLDYLDKNNNDGGDIMGCILCSPELDESEEVELETTSDVSIFVSMYVS